MMILPLIAVIIMMAAMTTSCREKVKPGMIILEDVDKMPTMLTRDVSTLISDSGYTRYHIIAPLWLMFDNQRDPQWKFPEGLDMEKYDNNMKVDATIACDSAVYFSQKKIWRLDGNVRMRNTAGDKFLTQQIFWDQSKHSVYSDSFIHIERSNRIIEGYGFTSNEQMTNYTVNHPSGIFPVPERKNGSEATNSTAPQSDTIQSEVKK
ncbi:MAG: LPS export ABC transporter periplasmic protein LptC [Muribaculaceae bacterium]|nr:LPS export ABC transporter periplasmic protein LptC [Muribaculaceae bacterium]